MPVRAVETMTASRMGYPLIYRISGMALNGVAREKREGWRTSLTCARTPP
jgi:hypothetical protein